MADKDITPMFDFGGYPCYITVMTDKITNLDATFSGSTGSDGNVDANGFTITVTDGNSQADGTYKAVANFDLGISVESVYTGTLVNDTNKEIFVAKGDKIWGDMYGGNMGWVGVPTSYKTDSTTIKVPAKSSITITVDKNLTFPVILRDINPPLTPGLLGEGGPDHTFKPKWTFNKNNGWLPNTWFIATDKQYVEGVYYLRPNKNASPDTPYNPPMNLYKGENTDNEAIIAVLNLNDTFTSDGVGAGTTTQDDWESSGKIIEFLDRFSYKIYPDNDPSKYILTANGIANSDSTVGSYVLHSALASDALGPYPADRETLSAVYSAICSAYDKGEDITIEAVDKVWVGESGKWLFKKTTGQFKDTWKIKVDDGTEYTLRPQKEVDNCSYNENGSVSTPITFSNTDGWLSFSFADDYDGIGTGSSVAADWEEGGKIYEYFMNRQCKIYPVASPDDYLFYPTPAEVRDALLHGEARWSLSNASVAEGKVFNDVCVALNTAFNADNPIAIEVFKPSKTKLVRHLADDTEQEYALYATADEAGGADRSFVINVDGTDKYVALTEADTGLGLHYVKKLSDGTMKDMFVSKTKVNTYTVTITQSANQTITVNDGTTDHTETFTAPEGTKLTATITPAANYTAGTLNQTSVTLSADTTFSATAATLVQHTLTITQSANQTIHVYTPSKDDANKVDHTATFKAPHGTTFDVVVTPASGYTAGTVTVQ